jgi:hypothetical protein
MSVALGLDGLFVYSHVVVRFLVAISHGVYFFMILQV